MLIVIFCGLHYYIAEDFIMFETILSNLKLEGEDKDFISKRKHERRKGDQCVGVIAGRTYPVENWSPGGVLVFGDPKPFAVASEMGITLKFKMRDEIVDVPHRAKIVRKTHDRIAFQFAPLTRQIHKAFQSVIDDYVTAGFADSQVV